MGDHLIPTKWIVFLNLSKLSKVILYLGTEGVLYRGNYWDGGKGLDWEVYGWNRGIGKGKNNLLNIGICDVGGFRVQRIVWWE